MTLYAVIGYVAYALAMLLIFTRGRGRRRAHITSIVAAALFTYLLWFSHQSRTAAARAGALVRAAFLGDRAEVQRLLDEGRISVDAWGVRGDTALLVAADAGRLEVVKLLVSRAPDVDLTDRGGR